MGSPRFYIIGGLTAWLAIACAQANFTKGTAAQSNVPTSCNTGATCSTNGQTIHVDRWITVPATSRKVDVLVVDDNSRSMQSEQQNMGSRMGSFVQSLTNNGLDWQIGIVTTDMSGTGAKQNGWLVPYAGAGNALTINSATPNGLNAFLSNIQMTIDSDPATWGSGDSRGIYAALTAIQRNQSGWMRPDAALAVIIMSNEDERKNGGQYYGYNLESGHDYPADLIGSVAAGKSLSVHSIIVKPGDSACQQQQQACTSVGTCGDGFYGNLYAQSSTMTGGVVGNICAADYSSQLTQIGGSIVTQTLSSFPLDCAPSGKVSVLDTRPANLQVSTAVNGSQLLFTPALGAGTGVHIAYDCTIQ
jgi:hypothetical protein